VASASPVHLGRVSLSWPGATLPDVRSLPRELRHRGGVDPDSAAERMRWRGARPVGGGRRGRTRLALHLSLLWALAGGKHESVRPTRNWAELIGLEVPTI
jgi:hypothetical protein